MTKNSADESISSRSCDHCGSLSAIGVEHYKQYRVSDEFERLCWKCAQELNSHTAEELTDEELVAAIVDGSIGHGTPAHAVTYVQEFRDGGVTASYEQDVADLDTDLGALIESARAHWLHIESEYPQKAEQLIEAVRQKHEVEEQEAYKPDIDPFVYDSIHAPAGMAAVVICGQCREPWEYNNLTHEMSEDEKEDILRGNGCPACSWGSSSRATGAYHLERLQSIQQNTSLDPFKYDNL
ncbi:hypothetical protein [Halorubrum sp. FL23]|uniref:hypothetical protein n=1 Tax=Halorubrum sp. FL23 TaxID=3458704 RepID=UPI004033757E